MVRRNRPLLLEPRPEALHAVAVVVDPVWAGHRCLVALRRVRGWYPYVRDVLAKAVARVIPVSDRRLRYARPAYLTCEQVLSRREISLNPFGSLGDVRAGQFMAC
jgi:hypothetical protein